LEEYNIRNEYGDWTVVREKEHGYWRVEPAPSDEYIQRFYEEEYLNAGYSFHDELYRFILERQNPRLFSRRGRVLEIGCGKGEKLWSFFEQGFECIGFEPNISDREVASSLGLEVIGEMFDPSIVHHRGPFDYILLSNVLEHVTNPKKLLDEISTILSNEGLLMIDVPNDFNDLQMTYLDNKGEREPWFLAPPVHLSYFTPKSLDSFLDSANLKVVKRTTRFPMEMFLLFGDDYIGDSELGKKCHDRRIAFEQSFMPDKMDILWRFYDSLAMGGFGRELIYICQKNILSIDWPSLEKEEGAYRIEKLDERHIEKIRIWRNQQIDILRQVSEISEEEQIFWYRENVITENNRTNPEFVLFGYFLGSELIGYGGLTNISWPDQRAEVSFLMATERSDSSDSYADEMSVFMKLMKSVGATLGISKLISETYSFREKHIQILEDEGFVREGELNGHTIQNGEFVDSICHAWFNRKS
jgi:SAM-dependent methyltransferase